MPKYEKPDVNFIDFLLDESIMLDIEDISQGHGTGEDEFDD